MDYSTLSAEELALTCFRSGDESAWAEFIRRFHPLISRIVVRVARQWGERSPEIADDLVQDTYVKLCAHRLDFLRNFASVHPDAIYGYIKVFTANLVRDRFKESRSGKRGGAAKVASIDSDNRELRSHGEKSPGSLLERNVLIQQIDACLRAISSGPSAERDRKIFWLYYRVGLPARAIAELPSIQLTTKGVESTLQRLTRQIRQRLVNRDHATTENGAEGIHQSESFPRSD